MGGGVEAFLEGKAVDRNTPRPTVRPRAVACSGGWVMADASGYARIDRVVRDRDTELVRLDLCPRKDSQCHPCSRGIS